MENYADRSKWTLEPFDVERAKRGDLVCTREGKPIHLTCITDNSVQCNTGDDFLRWELTGEFQGTERNLDLFHPVPVKEVKKKRIAFDASRVGEEGVEVVCRDSEDATFVSILKTDLKHNKSIVSVFVDKLGVEFIGHHYPDGRVNKTSESDFDLFLLVPDTEPALPSMQEVAEKIGSVAFRKATSNGNAITEDPLFEWQNAITILAGVAQFVNDGWEPDWEKNTSHRAWSYHKGQGFRHTITFISDGQICFKDDDALELAREILNSWEPGDAILKRALGVNA